MPAPNTPQDIIDRLRDLERQVRDLSGRVNIRPALNTIVGGTVTIKDGGSLIVQDTTGDNVLAIGRTTPDVDGEPQMATTIRRMDGSLAFAVYTSSTTGPQAVRMYDKNSSIVFADDLTNGGLAQPWVPLPIPVPQSTTTGAWYSTTSATPTTVARSIGWFQHPKVYIDVAIGIVGTATALASIVIGGATVANFTVSGSGVYDIPSWAWTGVPQGKSIDLVISRPTGTGTVNALVRSIYGRQS